MRRPDGEDLFRRLCGFGNPHDSRSGDRRYFFALVTEPSKVIVRQRKDIFCKWKPQAVKRLAAEDLDEVVG